MVSRRPITWSVASATWELKPKTIIVDSQARAMCIPENRDQKLNVSYSSLRLSNIFHSLSAVAR